MNTPIPLPASNQPRQAILFFLLLMLGNLTAQAQNNWTGNTNRDWNTAGNWSAGIPTATSDVVIPSGPANQPVLSTTATAKSVEVQAGASLSISNSGRLTISGNKSYNALPDNYTSAFSNSGTVVNGGPLVIGNTGRAGTYGLYNTASFSNITGGDISIDGYGTAGLWNQSGSFANSARMTIGSVPGGGRFCLFNKASFNNNVGGQIRLDRDSDIGLLNGAGGSFVNSATLTIGGDSGGGNKGIVNEASFSNSGCGALLRLVNISITVDVGSGALNNTGTIIENASGNSNIASNAGLVQNLNGGTFTIGTNTGLVTTVPGPLSTITATPSLTVTQGQSATLTASDAVSYSWSTGETTAAISVSVAGPYSVTGTTGGCSSTATVSITVKIVPTFTVSNPAICQGQYVNLGNYVSNKSPITGDLTYYTTQANAQAGTNALLSGLVGPVNNPITYYVRYDAAGSFSIQPIMVTLKPASPAPPVLTQTGHAYTGGVASVSVAQNSESVILAVPGCDGSVAWSGPNNFISFNSTISVPTSNTGSFTYSASCSSETACFSGSSQATVTVNVAVPVCGSVVYVTPGGAGSQNGSSWGNAFAGTALQTAINTAAGCGAQVWVASGLYTPATTLSMKNGVGIYGGFASSETSRADRVLSYPLSTTLSGGGVRQIFNNSNLDNTALLDGFVLANGKADFGGAMFNESSSPTLTNCSFQANSASQGGAMFNEGVGSTSSPVLTNCSFQANSALQGGAMFNNSGAFVGQSSPVLTNCSFQANTATNGGGAMLNEGFSGTSSPVLINCSFQANTSSFGGAMFNYVYVGTSSPVLINCSFQANTATNSGGVMYNNRENGGQLSPVLTNCVVFGNGGNNSFYSRSATVTATYSLFDDAVTGYNTGGTGNLTATVSPFAGTTSVALTSCSPAINAGLNTANTTPADLAGNQRIFGGQIDMGAVEFQGNPFSVSITANPSLTITQGNSATLTASAASSYSWTTGETTAAISVSVAGPYSVTGTTGGCSATASVTLTVNAPACGAGLSGPIWTGCVSTDWNTVGNWASGAVPTATDDVVIPSGPTNQPVLSTTATAKSVEVQPGASLSISSAGSLTINSFATLGGIPTAFYTQGTVTNHGTLILGNMAPVGLIGLHNTGTFTNTGTLQVDRATNQGINNRNSATFTNTGIITIGASVSMGTQGIWNQASFANTGGTITIDRTTSDGLLNSGNFVNSAAITIGASASVTGNGLTNNPGASFTNATGGTITIDRATGSGLVNTFTATFINSSAITIGSLGTIGGNGIGNPGLFTNSACATLTVLAPIFNNSNSFTNAGLFTVNTTRTHIGFGTLTNNGIINYPQGNPIPNVVNNDVIVAPFSLCGTSSTTALQLGGANSFQVGTTWYSDQALTQQAGTYDNGTNSFTPTSLSVGNGYVLYFTATDNVNNCTKTVSVSVTVNALPVASLLASGTLTCAQASVTLTASGGSSYTFANGSGVLGTPGSASTLVVSAAGTYSVTVGNASGCTSTTTTTVESNTAVPTVSITPASGTLTCANASLTLTASSSATALRWSDNSTATTLVVNASGVYSVTATGANGCTTVSNGVSVSEDKLPPTNVSLTSGTLTCAQTSVTLAASSTGGNSYTLSDGQSNTTGQFVVSQAGAYTVTTSGASGCTATATSTVSSNTAPPAATLTASSSVCAPTAITLTAGGGTSYSFSAGATQIGQSNQAIVTQSGTYSVTVSNANGCTATTSTSVTVNTPPAAPTLTGVSRTVDQSNTPLPLGQFATGTGGNALSFSGISGLLNPPQADISSSGIQSFSVSQTDSKGCVSVSTPFSVTVVATPASQTVCRSSVVVLTTGASGVRYEWYKNGQSAPFKLTEIASIQKGTATSSLTVVSIQTSASYYVKVFQANGSFSFDGPFTVTVNYGCIAPGARLTAVEVAEVPLTITLTPNPVSEGQLRAVVNGAGGQSLTLKLVDLRGEVVHQQHWAVAEAEQVVEWAMSLRPAEMYLLKAQTPGLTTTVKVLQQ